MAQASKAKAVKIDRNSDFLEGAASAADPTPDYDASIDTVAEFITDGFHEFFDGARQSFDLDDGKPLTVSIAGLTKAGQNLALNALDVWTFATGIEFKVVKKRADITFDDDKARAFAETTVDGNTITSAAINISKWWLQDNGKGIYDYSMLTYIHELGHALGLGHSGIYPGFLPPGKTPPPLFANDSWQVSIMSYESQTDNKNIDADYAIPVTPMMADLLAMRELYDIADLRTGDDAYSFKAAIKAGASLTVVDDGGLDRLNFAWTTKANVIDLSEEGISSINGVKGNVAIARGTVIEAAIGGSAGDTITGNGHANALYGGLGNDTLTGGGSEDFFVFDTKPSNANADVITDFTVGEDRLVFNNAIYTKIGADGDLTDAAFVANDTGLATDAAQRIIYNSVSGDVFYDADGSGAGKARLVAHITPGLDLAASDILVI